jgi:hypothetical protein
MANITSYPLTTPASDDLIIVSDVSVSGNPTRSAKIEDIVGLTLPYTRYVAKFKQGATDDPDVIELENNTGLTFTWVRSSEGRYIIKPDSSLTIDKTWVMIKAGKPDVTTVQVDSVTEDDIKIINTIMDTQGSLADGIEIGFIEIRIYP